MRFDAKAFAVSSILVFGCMTAAQEPTLPTNYPKALYDESKVPAFTLPDSLVMQNGEKVTDAEMWMAKRRPEILKLFEMHVYGRTMAGRPTAMTSKVTAEDRHAENDKAITKTVMLYFTGNEEGPSMSLTIVLPQKENPVPIYMLAGFGRFNQDVFDRGYGIVICHIKEIQADRPDGYADSIRAFFAPPGQTKAASDEWGAIGAWAWGLSRAMDYLETDKDIDAKKVCLNGFSRYGKVVMWAGARDERFAITFSGESGCGGAVLVRRGFGETVKSINGYAPHWFCDTFKDYNDKVNELPVDWHELVALHALRPVYIATAEQDYWGDPHGSFLSAKHAGVVYELFGKVGLGVDQWPAVETPVGDFIGYHNRSGSHGQTAYDWQQYLNFSDRHFQMNKYEGAVSNIK